MALTAEQRALRAAVAADTRWARTVDRSAATEAARAGLEARIAAQYGIPDDLPPAEYAKRLAVAKRAYYKGLSLKSSIARSRAAGHLAEAEAAEAELREAG